MITRFPFNFRYVVIAFIVLVLGLVGVGWFLFSSQEDRSVLLSAVVDGETVYAGEPFTIRVQMENDSAAPLNDVGLTVHMPDGFVLLENTKQRAAMRSIESITVGGMHEETFEVMAIPSSSGSTQKVAIDMVYSPGTLSARFERDAELDIPVAKTGFTVSVKAPEEVFSGEEFTIETAYERVENNDTFSPASEDALSDVKLILRVPDDFTAGEASPELDESSTSWTLGSVNNGTHGGTSLKGSISLPDGEAFDVRAELVAELFGSSYVIAEDTVQVKIRRSPLALSIAVDDTGTPGYGAGDTLTYALQYKNNADISFKSVVVRADLDGEMFDMGSVDTKDHKAVVNASKMTISWNESVVPAFKEVKPGEGGQIVFSIRLSDTYPIRRLNDKNFVAAVVGHISSPSVPDYLTATETIATAKKEVKIRGQVAVQTEGYFRDKTAAILNDGPFPPRVGQATQYTIHWKLRNYSTDVRDIVVKASLQDGVVATGIVKSNTDTVPEIDPEGGTITWRIGRLVATTGVISERPEAVFQVTAAPRANLAGKYMPLIGTTSVMAYDEFVEVGIESFAPAVTTELKADTTVDGSDGLVTQ